jgi:hypothetical protein
MRPGPISAVAEHGSSDVIVVGAAYTVYVARDPRLPAKGEVVRGDAFRALPGKGLNEAVAAARLFGSPLSAAWVRTHVATTLAASLPSIRFDYIPIRFAGLAAQELGGFVRPPGY